MAGGIVVIGEAVADIFPQAPSPPRALDLRALAGGGPANTAVALGRLGAPTTFLGRFSNGVIGRFLRDHVAAAGVDLSASPQVNDPAALAVASVDAEGRASYEFYVQGAADWQWRADELERAPGDAAGIHTGSLALAIAPGGPEIEGLLARRRPASTISIDPNVRPGIVDRAAYPAAMARWAGLADIVRLSDEDLEVVAPGQGFEEASRRWHAAGVRLVVLTRGGRGVTVSWDGAVVTVPAVAVQVVDTVGAGDAFTAGMLYTLWHEGHLARRLARAGVADVVRAVSFGVEVAARTCAVAGADPPWARDLGPPLGRGATA